MSLILPEEPQYIGVFQRPVISAAVLAARGLRHLSPERLRRVLTTVAGGARAASYQETKLVRDQVLTASARCRGGSACLIRSISVMLLSRVRGRSPVWSVGVIGIPPFAAHAWVEADGRIVDEPLEENDYKAFFKVAPGGREGARDNRHARNETLSTSVASGDDTPRRR